MSWAEVERHSKFGENFSAHSSDAESDCNLPIPQFDLNFALERATQLLPRDFELDFACRLGEQRRDLISSSTIVSRP